MSKKEKLIKRFLNMPTDFHYDEMVKLLGYFGFSEVPKGKKSGSRVKFEDTERTPIILHKPHPSGIMKKYQMKQSKRGIRLMKNLEYRGYTGSIEYSGEDDLLYGKVLGVKGLISYEGKTGNDLENDFKEAINAYLLDCEKNGVQVEKPFKGSFNVRVSPVLHQRAVLLAIESKVSLNSFVAEAIRLRVQES